MVFYVAIYGGKFCEAMSALWDPKKCNAFSSLSLCIFPRKKFQFSLDDFSFHFFLGQNQNLCSMKTFQLFFRHVCL